MGVFGLKTNHLATVEPSVACQRFPSETLDANFLTQFSDATFLNPNLARLGLKPN
jgi:hypothetical protein